MLSIGKFCLVSYGLKKHMNCASAVNVLLSLASGLSESSFSCPVLKVMLYLCHNSNSDNLYSAISH